MILSCVVRNTFISSRFAEKLGKGEEAEMWKSKARDVKKRLFEVCFDKDDAFFYDADRYGNKRRYLSSTIFHLFLEGVLDREEDSELIKEICERHIKNEHEFWTNYPFPSMAICDKSCEGHDDYNCWGYFTQGLIVLRCTRWMDLYGLSDEEFQRLRPYVQIPPAVKEVYFTEHDRARQDSLHHLRPEKFTQLTVLDLNTVDTLTLRKIPGVGVGYSRAIVSYRQRLGGFVSVAQLKDIEGLPDRIEEWFTIDENAEVNRISINKSDFKTLVRHPYLSYEQVKVITTHIRKYGQLRSWKDLQLYPEFTPQDFERLTPYFVFE